MKELIASLDIYYDAFSQRSKTELRREMRWLNLDATSSTEFEKHVKKFGELRNWAVRWV